MKQAIPEICDYDCPFAAFPPAETAGICRTMSAVWCRKLRELVNKNVRCEWRRRCEPSKKSAAAAPDRGKRPRPKQTHRHRSRRGK